MAGSARPPVLDDGRIPCPLCGGLVHPVAGRCKHCKEDLAARRTSRAAAPTPLPALQGNGSGPIVAGPMPHLIAQIAPNPIAVPMNGHGSVLPPRVTGRGMTAEKPRPSWKSWPMLVIVLASVAIIVAVVLMVWPPAAADAGRKIVQPPAPERMETDPLPPAGAGNANGADPWGGHSQIDPPKGPVAPRVTPDPLPPVQPQDPLADPFGPDPFSGLSGVASNGAAMMQAVMTHACKKLEACPNADDMTTAVCDGFKMFPKAPPPSCDAAQKCFEAIDKLDCNADTDPMSVMNMQSCVQAALSC